MKTTLVLLMTAATAMAATVADLNAGVPGGGEYTVPGGANPTVGSIICSWNMSGTSTPYALGICRDASYTYGVFYSPAFLRSYVAPSGSVAGSVSMAGFSVPRGGSNCHLGTGYFTISEASGNLLRHVNKTTGATAGSFGVSGFGTTLTDNGFNGTYYFVAGGTANGSFQLYSTSGSSAGSWTFPTSFQYVGGHDYVAKALNVAGSYYVMGTWQTGGGNNIVATYPGGSVVASWNSAPYNYNGMMCGPSSNAAKGDTVWGNEYSSSLNAVERDLDNIAGVAPASIGHIKALYR